MLIFLRDDRCGVISLQRSWQLSVAEESDIRSIISGIKIETIIKVEQPSGYQRKDKREIGQDYGRTITRLCAEPHKDKVDRRAEIKTKIEKTFSQMIQMIHYYSQLKLVIDNDKLYQLYTTIAKMQPQTMKVFALISGGKDSIFNIKRCIDQGHVIVALGNLYNYDEEAKEQGKELDSYMYQTVGSNLSTAIAQCLDKPLYRQKILGTPKNTSLEYKGTDYEN